MRKPFLSLALGVGLPVVAAQIVELTWDKPTAGGPVESYLVHRGPRSADVGRDTRAFAQLAPGENRFTVQARNVGGASPMSDELVLFAEPQGLLVQSSLAISNNAPAILARLLVAPTHGSISWDGSNLVYRATSTGADALRLSLELRGLGARIDSALALTVTSAPAVVVPALVALDKSMNVPRNGYNGTTLATSPALSNTLWRVTMGPTNGTWSGTLPNLIYRPRTNYAGADCIHFVAIQGGRTSAPACIRITVGGTVGAIP